MATRGEDVLYPEIEEEPMLIYIGSIPRISVYGSTFSIIGTVPGI
jgi:hypothetical protein